jgi:hypothetical protein
MPMGIAEWMLRCPGRRFAIVVLRWPTEPVV